MPVHGNAALRRARCRRGAAVAIGMGAWSAADTYGDAKFWDDGGGVNDSWRRADNWNPDGVPTATSDVTLGIFVETNRIEAEGSATLVGGIQPHYVFSDPALKANSLTISTAHPVEVDGRLDIDGWFGGTFYTTLTLSSGYLARQDVAGVEGDQTLNLNVRLGSDGIWDVAGSGVLTAAGISESGGPRAFTKTGAGTLAAQVFVSGATTISQGTFRGSFVGTGAATIARGAAFHVVSARTSPPIRLNGSGSGSASMAKVGTGIGEISGPLTIVDNPLFSADAGGTLLVSGGITSVNNSGFGLVGPGELRLSGPGIGSILADLRGGQLTIAHDSALGTGSVFAQNALGGSSSLAFADGVTFANPISLIEGTIRGLGNSTVTSNITISPFFTGNHTFDVPGTTHSLTFTGSVVDYGSGAKLTKTGAGTVVLRGASTYISGTTVQAGTLLAANAEALGTGALTVANGATARVQAGLSQAVNLPAPLGITATGATGGTLDITDGALVVRHADQAAAFTGHTSANNLTRNALNEFAWDQPGITSSTVQADVANGIPAAVGILLNNDGGGNPLFYGDGTALPQFEGRNVNANSVLVKDTLLGDGDLNGVVDTVDFALFQAGYTGASPYIGFAFGDYDYNGVVDTVDFGLFQAGYQYSQSHPPSPEMVAFATEHGLPLVAAVVPEPATLGFLAAGAVGLVGRRRRGA
jgi:autotransporter-associated beta strand protein